MRSLTHSLTRSPAQSSLSYALPPVLHALSFPRIAIAFTFIWRLARMLWLSFTFSVNSVHGTWNNKLKRAHTHAHTVKERSPPPICCRIKTPLAGMSLRVCVCVCWFARVCASVCVRVMSATNQYCFVFYFLFHIPHFCHFPHYAHTDTHWENLKIEAYPRQGVSSPTCTAPSHSVESPVTGYLSIGHSVYLPI